MFSNRFRWDLAPNPISRLLDQKRDAGTPILDLAESNPTHAGLTYPSDLLASLSDPSSVDYDPRPRGLLAAREAVSAYYRGQVLPERILLTTSTSEAYSYLFKLLTNPGDHVLVPRPSYPLFEFLAGLELVETVPYALEYNGSWAIDFDDLERNANERTRAIVLVNPNNPTGSFLKRAELDRLLAFCAERNVAIISDEVFADYAFADDPDRVSSLTDVDSVLTFCLSGLSKVCGLPQLKLGWIVVNGPSHQTALALERLELIADTFLSVSTPVQHAAERLLNFRGDIQGQISTRTRRNLSRLQNEIARDSPFRVLNVEGGWYAVLQVPRIHTEEEWALMLLRDHNVLVQPGFFYDFEGEGYLVLSLLTPEESFDRGLAAILSSLQTSSEVRYPSTRV